MTYLPGQKIYIDNRVSGDGRTPWFAGTCLSAPPGSKRVGTVTTSNKGTPTFVPDAGGTYVLAQRELMPSQLTDGYRYDGPTTILTVAEKLTKSIGTNPDRAKVVVAIVDSCVSSTTPSEGEVTPRIESESNTSRSANAIANSSVKSAVAALVGMSAASVASTGLPAVEAAYAAALADPAPKPANADPGAAALVQSGWSKS